MKKIFLSIFVLLLVLLVGCNSQTTTAPITSTKVEETIPKNLIIFIGDGMSPDHTSALEIYDNIKIPFLSWNSSTMNTNSLDTATDYAIKTTDSAAAGTALATGVLTINGHVGKDRNGNDLETILDVAHKLGKSTGIITTDTAYGATPAAFSAHTLDRYNNSQVLSSQAASQVDLIISEYFSMDSSIKQLYLDNDYSFLSSFGNAYSYMDSEKLFIQARFQDSNGEYELKDALKFGYDFLNQNEEGFVLMVEEAYIDKNSHNNVIEGVVNCVRWLNNAVNDLLTYMSKETCVIVTADHECGALAVSSESIYTNQYGNLSYKFQSTDHTTKEVGIYIYGYTINLKEYQNSKTRKYIKNSDIFKIYKQILNIE